MKSFNFAVGEERVFWRVVGREVAGVCGVDGRDVRIWEVVLKGGRRMGGEV